VDNHFIGIDVGGTTIKAGIVDAESRVIGLVSLPTCAARGQDYGLQQMELAARQALATAGIDVAQIAAIGVAVPGPLDLEMGVMLEPPNLKPWRNVPVRSHLAQAFGLPVVFQNDANAAAYGEFCAGAGRGARSLVMFTLGTGIGCGIVVEGRLLGGRHSHGAESGHMRIEIDKPRPCACGRAGCLEAYASVTALLARAREALSQERSSSLFKIPSADLTSEVIFQEASNCDSLADRLVEETAFYLAIGAVNLMHTIDPDVVVFGGGMAEAGGDLLNRIRRHIAREAFPVPAAKTSIRLAELGPKAGVIGAAGWARAVLGEAHLRR
jgi:glucokinase